MNFRRLIGDEHHVQLLSILSPRVELPIRIVLVHLRRLNSQMLPAPDEETGKRQDKDANSADGVENIGHPDCCNPSRHGKDKDSAEGIPDGCQSR